ncbi:hypothetical protein [Kineococcus sp. SYSU DK005]|uniref:hypothetical protein n=1 Tax=Kineococcus sp. SYSU DK005 TaxID=3383126 RepID=UPI003D7D0B3E
MTRTPADPAPGPAPGPEGSRARHVQVLVEDPACARRLLRAAAEGDLAAAAAAERRRGARLVLTGGEGALADLPGAAAGAGPGATWSTTESGRTRIVQLTDVAPGDGALT